MSEIREITGPEEHPVAWTDISEPTNFAIGQATYRLAVQYSIPIEPYLEAILRPEWDVFV